MSRVISQIGQTEWARRNGSDEMGQKEWARRNEPEKMDQREWARRNGPDQNDPTSQRATLKRQHLPLSFDDNGSIFIIKPCPAFSIIVTNIQ